MGTYHVTPCNVKGELMGEHTKVVEAGSFEKALTLAGFSTIYGKSWRGCFKGQRSWRQMGGLGPVVVGRLVDPPPQPGEQAG